MKEIYSVTSKSEDGELYHVYRTGETVPSREQTYFIRKRDEDRFFVKNEKSGHIINEGTRIHKGVMHAIEAYDAE